MKFKALILPALLATATFAAPAIAGQQIILPNGASVNYEGTAAPAFYTVPGPDTPYFEAYDSGLDAYFHYDSAGNWLGVSGVGAANVPNVPTIPAEVTLPASPANATGLTIPYAGSGIPQVFVDTQGNYTVIDAVAHKAQVLDSTGSFMGGGSWGAGTLTTGSSGFGSSQVGASTTTTTGGGSSFGSTSGSPTSSGVTSGGCTSSTTSGCFSGGGTDVPAPAVFGLFGIAAGGLALARRRRRKGA